MIKKALPKYQQHRRIFKEIESSNTVINGFGKVNVPAKFFQHILCGCQETSKICSEG
jgi:hypothetical protein